MKSRLARAQGALVGLAVGDALGQMTEFLRPHEVRVRFPYGIEMADDIGTWSTLAGQPTDDTEMALAMARSIVEEGGYSRRAVMASYVRWLRSDPFDVGATTRVGLEGHPNPESEANGSLMRIAPLAVWGACLDDDELAVIARLDSSITHPSIVCCDAVAAYAVMLASAIRGSGWQAYDLAADWVAEQERFAPEVRRLFEHDTVPPVADFHTHSGWVLVALQNALHHFTAGHRFEEALRQTVAQGGDADTNGAILGALLGAAQGRRSIPQHWQRTVLECRADKGRHPRPPYYWATDLPELAAELLTIEEQAGSLQGD